MQPEAAPDRKMQLKLYRAMLRARRLDERAWLLQRQGKVAFHVSCIGHEDNLTCGCGVEIAAVITAEAFTDLDAPVRRLASLDVPAVPYSPHSRTGSCRM